MFKEFVQDVDRKHGIMKSVYQTIHQYGPITKAELLERTQLKPTTLARMIDGLMKNECIREEGIGESSGGRPPVLYHINPTRNHIIGIDVSRTETRVILVDLLFQTIDRKAFTMTPKHTPDVTLAHITQMIHDLMKKHQITMDQLLGIGLGAVGPLDRKKGMILQPEDFRAPGWVNMPFVQGIYQSFPVKICLENGANAAAFGEYYKMSLPYKHILHCISGAGLRCGVISNGQLVRSKVGDASAFGHMIVDVNGRRCSCGKKGCLTSYISFSAIIQDIKNHIQNGRYSVLSEWTQNDLNLIEIDHVIRAAREEDPLATEVLSQSAYYYGIGIANMVNLIHPEAVILSGSLIHSHSIYYQEVVHSAQDHVYLPEKNHVTFTQGTLKYDAVAIGAAILIFDSFFQ